MARIVLDMKDALPAGADKSKKQQRLDELREILKASDSVQCVLLIFIQIIQQLPLTSEFLFNGS